MTEQRPAVLFVCVHNAGRSQMAPGYLRHFAGDGIEVRSAGSLPAEKINPIAVEAMREEGIDLTAAQRRVLTPEAVQASDVVITMAAETCALSLRASALRTGRSIIRPVRASQRFARSAMPSVLVSKPWYPICSIEPGDGPSG